ncbi:MAG TPA: hypothetical protein VGN56_00175 [Candidatus Paceibacterota bacterium]|jgi:hypothetical protein|nr:hypothetical protein [Candidatus Paceibacterota bacterium]
MPTSQTGSLQYIISYVIDFINQDLVPFVFALAFALFLFGVFRFYFVKGADDKSRTEGRGFIIWSIVAFAVMVSVWGLVNIVRGSVPFLNNDQPGIPTFNPATGTSGSAPSTVQGTPATVPGTPSTVQGTPAPAPSAAGGGPGDTCVNGDCSSVNGLF